MRKPMFGSVSLTASSLAIIGIAVFAFQTRGQAEDGVQKERKAMMESCAKTCSDCQRACEACATHCTHLLQEGKKEHMTTLMTCQDCATFCSAAAQIVARGGPFAVAICEACTEACKTCATECAKFPNDMMMKSCADECLKCEGACRGMLRGSMPTK